MVKGQAGKGDRFRQVNQDKYGQNYESIFGQYKINNWNLDDEEDSTDNEENENEQSKTITTD